MTTKPLIVRIKSFINIKFPLLKFLIAVIFENRVTDFPEQLNALFGLDNWLKTKNAGRVKNTLDASRGGKV
jgi:hypothetical protein